MHVDRRSFLLATAGLALAAACNRPGSDKPDIEVDDSGDDGAPLSLVLASYVHVTGIDQRVTLALVQGDGPVRPDNFDVVFETPDGKELRARGELHTDGIDLPYLLVRRRFETPGPHVAKVRYRGKEVTAAVVVQEPSKVQVPVPGRPLIGVATPTVADSRGVSPICTRDPVCPLHDVSLDAALTEKRPIALLFATPALCQSKLCGPVLENLLALHAAFGSRVRFLHAEIYTDMSGKTLAPAVQAYHLDNEPFLFLADTQGVVRDRLDNAFDRVEVRAAMERLVD